MLKSHSNLKIAVGSSPTRTAVLITNVRSVPLLCPLFSICDGVLLYDASDGSTRFHSAECLGTTSICDLILKLKPERLICGFIAAPDAQKLRRAGIDVRLGSCCCQINELIGAFFTLPRAHPYHGEKCACVITMKGYAALATRSKQLDR